MRPYLFASQPTKPSNRARLLVMVSLCSIAGCAFDSGLEGAEVTEMTSNTDVSLSALSATACSARARSECSPDATCSRESGEITCTCNEFYEGDGRTCSPRCDSTTLATGIEHCLRARDDGTVDQRWDLASEPWAGQYVQADEPSTNYCGPTAVKNFLSWYGSDEDYEVLGEEMRTNTWHTDAGFAGSLLGANLEAGTLPGDLWAALARRAPEGYTACIKQGDGDFENIRSALAAGDQVVYLESRGTDRLHWAVATGLYLDGETPTVRLANAVDRNVDDFVRDWSLSRVGDAFKRDLLATLFGLSPYTLIRWIPTELANGPSCP